MLDPTKLLLIALIWFCKSTSLPKLNYNISNKRGISISKLQVCEKLGQKAVKLCLDVKYLEACVELDIFPKFLRFKPPNISVYQDLSSVYNRGGVLEDVLGLEDILEDTF